MSSNPRPFAWKPSSPRVFALATALSQVIKAVDANLLTSSEDCKNSVTSLSEAKRAWRDYQLHQRR